MYFDMSRGLMDTIDEPEGFLEMSANNVTTNASTESSLRQASNNITSYEIPDFFDSTDLHMGVSLDDLLYTSDFNTMSSH
jgi:hypothetical protein